MGGDFKGFKGKGEKGKGEEQGGEPKEGEEVEGEEGESKKPSRPEKDVPPVVLAQRAARARFEKDILDKLQGRWKDEDEEGTFYSVEGNVCAVSTSDAEARTFRNRLGVFGHDFCWDARRFWHYLDMKALSDAGDTPETVTWTPGKDSPATRPITWLRAPPEPEKEEKEGEGGEAEEKKEVTETETA